VAPVATSTTVTTGGAGGLTGKYAGAATHRPVTGESWCRTSACSG
jgi:hypothetical protein